MIHPGMAYSVLGSDYRRPCPEGSVCDRLLTWFGASAKSRRWSIRTLVTQTI